VRLNGSEADEVASGAQVDSTATQSYDDGNSNSSFEKVFGVHDDIPRVVRPGLASADDVAVGEIDTACRQTDDCCYYEGDLENFHGRLRWSLLL
jgi:hypothetical protein